MNETATARHSLAHDLHHTGSLYAQKAQTLMSIANSLDQMDDGDVPEDLQEYFPTRDAGEARGRAMYAAMCANVMADASRRIQQGDCDWAYIQMLADFTETEALAPPERDPSAS